MDQAENMIGALYLQDLMRHMMLNSHALPMDKWYEVKDLCPHPNNECFVKMYELALRYAEENELFIKRGSQYRIQPFNENIDVILPGKDLSYA
jgi:hypothetical protein